MSTPTAAPARTLADHLGAAARERPDAAAMILPHGRRRRRGPDRFRATSYARLDRRSDALAAGLGALGVGPGVRAALMVPPGEDFFALAFALLKARAVPVLIDPGIGLRHLKTCLGEVGPEAFLGVPRAHAARRALGWCPQARIAVTAGPPLPGGGRTLRSVERAGEALLPFAPPPVDDAAVAAIAFTSGSTGVPKGVEYRHGHFLAQVALLRDLLGVRASDVNLATFPPFALHGPALGVTTVVPRMDFTRPARVDPARLVDTANRFGVTQMFGSPALLDTVTRWGGRSGARMPALRQVMTAGAPVPRELQRRTLAMLAPGAQVHTPYGATEALPVTSISSRELLGLTERGICVGRPLPGVDLALIGITDEPIAAFHEGLPVPPGEVGEVVVRGPNVTERYAERPAATAAAKLDWDGRVGHRMGDVGYLDGEGRLWFCGRKAHRVVTPLGTMFSVPVEEVYNAHPAVRRSALVGLGEPGRARPVICIELAPGARASAALSRELMALGTADPLSAEVATLLYHPGFPVDIRHNAKIDRAALAGWARRRLPR